jgi:hypothetical protein
MEDAPVISDDFRNAMTQWVELKKQLTEARSDMKILNKKEKELKEFIKNYMSKQEIDNVNLKKGKVTLRTTKKKASFTKAAVEKGLNTFFNGDEVKTETAMNCITDNLEVNESKSISLTGIKNK